MRIERALALRNSLKTRIADIYGMAVIAGMTSSEINAASIAARNDLPKATPSWVRAYGEGYEAALRDRLYDSCLVFGGYVEGRFYSVYRWRADYYEKHGIAPCAFADDGLVKGRGHYWRESIEWRGRRYSRDGVKPYYVEESSDAA